MPCAAVLPIDWRRYRRSLPGGVVPEMLRGLLSDAKRPRPAPDVKDRAELAAFLARTAAEVSWILPTEDGRLWLGTHKQGVVIVDPAGGPSQQLRPDARRPEAALPQDIVLCIVEGPRREKYIATKRGLYRAGADGRQVERLALAGRDPAASTWALWRQGETLWIGGGTEPVGSSARKPSAASKPTLFSHLTSSASIVNTNSSRPADLARAVRLTTAASSGVSAPSARTRSNRSTRSTIAACPVARSETTRVSPGRSMNWPRHSASL